MEEYRGRLTIKSWAEDDRPREKLINKGSSVLSHAELIAILIRTGTKKESAVDLAKRILDYVKNNLSGLVRMSVKELCQFPGMGKTKAVTILAALELGARISKAEALSKQQVTDSRTMYDFLKPRMAYLPHEEFRVVYLNRANKVIGEKQISIGGVTGTVADPKVIFRSAIEMLASSIILAHNHPSGNLKPSKADIDLTKKMKEAGALMEIEVLDHLIISESGYFSFADEGIL